ncbi:MAG TPA: SPOR domain-containing protein [Acidobacteria bacterium]|nr:SPOR domain-containing protein [Acidobacteriota bacterium]
MVNSPRSDPAPSAKQLVFLAIMATVVAVIVFLCGVLVGRGVPARRTAIGTVSDVLPGGRAQVAIGVPVLPVDEDAETASPLADLSYFERLNGTEPVVEAADLRRGDLDASTADGDPPGAASAIALTEGSVPPLTTPSAPEEADPGSAGGMFVLQVAALAESDEANQVAEGLVASGYPAFVVAPAPDAPVAVFRVRVGPYVDRAEAEAAGRRLETEQRFKPWFIQL